MLRRWRNRALSCFCFAAAAASGIAVQAQSLADTLSYAYENSFLLEADVQNIRAADENLAISLSQLRPALTLFSNIRQLDGKLINDSLTATLGLQVDWVLWDGGNRQNTLLSSREAVLSAQQALINSEQDILFAAANAFLTLRQDLQILNLRENNLRVITQELRAAEDRFQVGEVTRTDVAIAQARLAAGRSAYADALGQVEISKAEYKLAVGRAPSTLLPPPAPPQLPNTLESARLIAQSSHPTIRQLQHEVAANEFLARAEDANRRGTFSLSGELSTSAQDGIEDNRGSLTLQYSLPLYSGGQLSALRRRAVAQLNSSRALLLQQGRVITEAVESAWQTWVISRAQVEASQQEIRAARIAFDGTREEASLGARTTIDVLNAEQELLDAQTSALQAETNAYVAVYGVLSAMGMLTAEHLGLTVQRVGFQSNINSSHNETVSSRQYGADLDRILNRVGAN